MMLQSELMTDEFLQDAGWNATMDDLEAKWLSQIRVAQVEYSDLLNGFERRY